MALAVPSLSAHAQSSATLYGIISAGVEYVSNEGGAHNIKMLSGPNQASRWGLRIVEDLGSGLSAVAVLENGFDVMSGKLGQGGREFGRQAWVGINSRAYGSLTAGRQNDMFYDFLLPLEASAANGLGVSIADNDNIFGSYRYSNSLKYVSPVYHGFKAEALYAFSNKAGDFSQNRAVSAGGQYAGNNFSIVVAYLNIDSPGLANPSGAVSDDYAGAPFQLFHTSPLSSTVGVARQRQFGGGGSYATGKFTLNALFTDVRYKYLDQTSLHLQNYQATLLYQTTPSLLLSAAYLYTNGNYGGINVNSHWNTFQLSADYLLSKRTDIYIFGDYVRSSGPLAFAKAEVYLNAPSTTHNQVIALLGIRHKF
ncbi:porin [Burkholderia pseudomultivorans]|uniref:Porin n=1 Tax=Burkholderia pseudomultivorans TaxID=1207504 RepID=A0A132EWX3_9BURK|nr:porin [Burkholderia pseudomultivorans]